MSELSKQQQIRQFAHSSFDNILLSKLITIRFQYALILTYFMKKRKNKSLFNLQKEIVYNSVNNACKYAVKNNRTGNNEYLCSKP